MHTNYLVFEMEFCRYLLNGINLNYFMKNYYQNFIRIFNFSIQIISVTLHDFPKIHKIITNLIA